MKVLCTKTDHELIHSFRDGDLLALEALVIRHKDKLYTSILFLVKDKYLAEDIFQDVLIKIIDTIRGGRYTEEGKFLPWAMRIAHNLCVDHFRKVKRTPAIKTSDDRDIFEVINFTEDGADVKIMKRQSHDRGRPLISREVVVNLIGSTTTTQGLHIKAFLDENTYAPGIKVSDEGLATLAIERDEFHGEWNYRLRPRDLQV